MTTAFVVGGIPCAHCEGCHPTVTGVLECGRQARARFAYRMEMMLVMHSDDDADLLGEFFDDDELDDDNDSPEPDWDDPNNEPDWGDDEDTTAEDVFTTNGDDPPPF